MSEAANSQRAAWTEPGAFLVAPGVWRIPTVLPMDGLKAVNIYALVDDAGLTLIDGGWALDAARDALVAGLAEIGAQLGDVQRFLVTHAHRDHYTAAVSIRREFGTRVLIGEGERNTLEKLSAPTPPSFASQTAALARHGAGPVMQALSAIVGSGGSAEDNGYELPDAWIASGESFAVGSRTLEAIATPGHTRGHVVFADRAAGLLFAGDHVLPHITPSIAFEVDPPRLALRDYLGSLRAVRSMPDMTLMPAHGPAGDAVHARIDALLAHHDQRLDEIASVLGADGLTGHDVAGQIGWTSRRRKFADLDPFNQMLAVFETVLHLNLLVLQDRATETVAGGVVFFTRRAATAG